MTKYISLFSATILFLALVFSSCQNQVDGCTDPAALNYDPNATQDDGSCQYAQANNQGGIILWFRQSTANNFTSTQGVTAFNYIINGVLAGTQTMSQFDAAAPACDAPNRVTVRRAVTGTLEYVPYVITTQTGDSIITGLFPFQAGACNALEITP